MLFMPIQQELDCIDDSGRIVGKIKFDGSTNEHVFYLIDDSISLSADDKANIADRLSGLDAGSYSIPMQDDD